MSEFTKYIDSVVGNIARKIEDEFNENDHPRDKGGKFTSKGGEGKGSKKEELVPETETEREAKLELIREQDREFERVKNELLEYCEDLETTKEALRALNFDNDFDTLESAHEALEEAIKRKPELAKELLEDARIGYDEHVHWKKKESRNPDTASEDYAKQDTDDIIEKFVGSGIFLSQAMEDLGLNVRMIPEEYLAEEFAEELYNNPRLREKAKDYISRYTTIEEDEPEEEVESASTAIAKELRRNMSTHVEDLVDYAKDDGYDAELESEEYMIVRKDGKEYRAHIDRAGDTYYVDRVEEL